jgi:anti-sigma regulatory factor (Ser/Thr protein kinase)
MTITGKAARTAGSYAETIVSCAGRSMTLAAKDGGAGIGGGAAQASSQPVSFGAGPAFHPCDGPQHDYCELELASVPCAAGDARRHAIAVLGQWGLDPAGETACSVVTIVSELVTNGVRASLELHRTAAPPVWLRLTSRTGHVQIEVYDTGPGIPVARQRPGAENGMGLVVVNGLSAEWGARPLPGTGKVVWAMVAR